MNRSFYTDDKFIRFVAYAICFTWGAWVSLVGLIVIGNMFYDQFAFLDDYLLVMIGSVTVISVFSSVLLTLPACRVCRKKIFLEQNKSHQKFKKNYWLGGWASIVIKIVREKSFVCMRCGGTINLQDD